MCLTCSRTCHTMQVVSLEPEIRWIPQWSVDKQVTMSGGEERMDDNLLFHSKSSAQTHFYYDQHKGLFVCKDESPMCLMCCPTVLPLTNEVTRTLLSQWPALKSNLPSCETTNSPAVTSTPGAKGPDRRRWVLGKGKKISGHQQNLQRDLHA